MRFAIRLAVGLLALSALVVPTASAASAQTEAGGSGTAAAGQTITFCNNGIGITYSATFPQSGGWSTYVVHRGECQSYTRSNPNEPFIIRVVRPHTGEYRDHAGFIVGCYANRAFTVSGTYQATLTPTRCARIS